MVRLVLIAGGGVLFLSALIFGTGWWTHGRFVESTNDAYVQADQVTISPKISGYVEAVYVADNQAVKAGQPLLKIDGGAYDATLASQLAAVAARLNANARRTLIGSFGKACSAPDRDALAAMVKAHPIAGNERPIDRALETVEVCARARSRLNAELGTWLRAHP